MQGNPLKTKSSESKGFLQNTYIQINNLVQKPDIWLILGIFLLTILIGFWIGTKMVVQLSESGLPLEITLQDSSKSTILLLEVNDLSESEPELISIWFIHLNTGEKPRLGFSPVLSIDMKDHKDFKLLKQFSLDSKRTPSREFLLAVTRKGFFTQNYIIVDKQSSIAFINWFAGKDLSDPIAIDDHTMAQYGQVLRNLCNSFALPSKNGSVDFPWSRIADDHFSTNLKFNQVLKNLSFLTSTNTPLCEMVPLP
jgi:hypothetical protein